MIQSSLAAAALEQEGIEESLAKRSDTGKSPIKGAPKPKTVKTSVRFSDILRQAKDDAVIASGTPSVVPPMPFDAPGTASTTYGTQIPAPTARNRSGAEAAQFQALTGRTQTQWNIDFDPNSIEAIMAEWDRRNIGRVTRGFDVPKEAQAARDQFRSQVAQQMAAPPTMKQSADRMVSGMTEWQPPEVSLQGFGESMLKLAPSGLAQAGRIQIGKMIGFSEEDIAEMESRGETHALDMLADIAGGLAAMGAGGGGAIGAFGKVMAASDVAQGLGLAGIAANPLSEAAQGRPGQLQEMGGAFAQSLNPFEDGISPLEKTARGVSTALLMLGGVAGVAALKRAHLAKKFESMGASAKEAADLALSVEQRLRMLETGSRHKTEAARPTDDAYVFASPNTKEDMTLGEVVAATDSQEHARIKSVFDETLAARNANAKTTTAIGDWADGAENTVVVDLRGAANYDEVKSIAADLGVNGAKAGAPQKAVVPFVAEAGGPDALYDFVLKGMDLDQARDALTSAGIEFRTLVRSKDGTRVVVFDPGGKMNVNVKNLTGAYEVDEVRFHAGRGEFLGADTRIGGLREFRREAREASERSPATKADGVDRYDIDGAGADHDVGRVDAGPGEGAKLGPPDERQLRPSGLGQGDARILPRAEETPQRPTEVLGGGFAETKDHQAFVERAKAQSTRAQNLTPKAREEIEAIQDPRERRKAVLEYARARAEREASGEGPVNVASGFTEDDLFIASQLARSYVEEGVALAKEVVEKIVADLGEGFRPQAEEAAARVLGDQAASEFGRQAPKGARVPVGEGTRKVSNIEDSLNRFAGALGKTVFKDREKGRRLGSFRPSDTRVNIRNHGDLPTAAHELFHDADDAAGHSLAAAKEQWFQEQVLGRDEYRTTVPDRATPEVERAETWAEFMTAYAMNPQKAAELSPDAVKWVETNLDAKTLEAVREFSEDVRGWNSMPAADKVAANVRFTTDKPKPGVRKLVKQFFDGTDETGQWHPSGWDRFRSTFTNDATIVEQAVREQMRRAGKSELAPSKDPIGLISDNRYLAQKVDSILEHGMVDSKGDRVTGPIAEMFDALDTSSGEALEQDLRGAFAHMISQRHAERAANIRKATDDRLKDLIEGLESGDKTIESNGTTYTRAEAQSAIDAARKNDQVQIDRLTGVGRGVEGDEGIHRKALEEVEADPERKARYDAFAQRYRDWADSLLRYSVENGYLSKTDYDRIKSSNEFYVAFAREGFEDMAHPQKGASSLTQGSGLFQTLEGSTREIKDPFASILAMTHKVVREVDRNSVLKAVYDLAERPPREFQGEGRADTSALFRVVDEGTEGAVRVRVDGKDRYLWMAPEVRESFETMGKTFQELPFDPFHAAASIQRATITIVPAFATRNWMRDLQQRILVSRVGSGPVFLPSKAQAKLRKEELEMFYGQYGAGIGRSHYMDGPKQWSDVQRTMMKEMTRKGSVIPVNPWKAYKNLIGKSEMHGRLQEFQKAYGAAKGKGLSDHEARLFAAREARDLIDFMRAGTATRLLNRYIPFLNAAVQGSSVMWTSAAKNPGKFAARMAATAAAPSVANYLIVMAMGDLEEYRKLPAYQRDLFYNVKIGDRWFSLPKAFEAGVLAAAAERAFDMANGNGEALDGYAGSLLKSAIPFDPDWSTLMGGVRGFQEVRANFDTFRDKPIKPPWDPGAIEGRDTSSASALGELLQKAFANTQDARDIDHIIETQLGNVGRMATSASEVAAGERKAGDWLLQQTGLVRNRPVSNQRDAAYVAAKLKEFGVSAGTELKEYRALMSEAFKDEKAKTKFYAEAKRYREKIEKAIANNPNFEKRQEAIKSIFQSGGKKLAAG